MRPKVHARRPLRVRDLPDFDIATRRVEPEHVAGAVGVEVAAERRLISCRVRADVDTAGPFPAADLPEIEIAAACVLPEQIAGAGVIDIARGGCKPACRMRAGV